MRRLRPLGKALKIENDGKKMFPCGLTAEEITFAGRRDSETFRHYCNKLLKRGSWGGAAECYIASQVFLLPIYVFQHRMPPQVYFPNDDDPKTKHRLTVKYDGSNHYDAILERCVPLLDL